MPTSPTPQQLLEKLKELELLDDSKPNEFYQVHPSGEYHLNGYKLDVEAIMRAEPFHGNTRLAELEKFQQERLEILEEKAAYKASFLQYWYEE